MELELRKFAKFVDKTFIEGGKKAKEPVLLVSVAAVFKNPWHGKGFVEDLKPIILDLAPKLGDVLVPELIKERWAQRAIDFKIHQHRLRMQKRGWTRPGICQCMDPTSESCSFK